MASDVDNIITIKQLLINSIIDNENFDYIKNVLIKNIEDCNLLYTQVCYLIKLFLLSDSETNKNKPFNDYKFDELFIRKCFKLIKTGEYNNEDLNNNSLLNRIIKFFNNYNSNSNNNFKFIKPDNVSSITHITDALSRDIQTNIVNNIELNYFKYIKEYITVNTKIKFSNIDDNQINKIYFDIIDGTLYSNVEYHSWIKEHILNIIPVFNNKIKIISFKDGIDNYCSIFVKYIKKFINENENQNLLNLIHINGDDKKKIFQKITYGLINDLIDFDKYTNWVNENKNIIVNEFNSSNKIDLEKELNKNPYMFIPFMLFINRNLELNNSSKNYQIIPLRTNLTPKFIPISVDSLVDILDPKYLLGNIKNYYHSDNKKGLILFDTYFKFDSKYIKNVIKKGFIFSGLIYTNGYEINYIFNSKSYDENKNNFHSKGKNEIKHIKENTKDLSQEEKDIFIKKHNEDKDKIKKEQTILNKEKNKKIKLENKDKTEKILNKLENEILILKNKYNQEINEIEKEHYLNLKKEFDKINKTLKDNKKLMNDVENKLNDDFLSKNVYLKHEYDRNYLTLINDYNNTIDEKFKEIKNKESIQNNLIIQLKNKIFQSKKELKQLKKDKFDSINKQYKKETKKINNKIKKNKENKKIISRLSKKLIKKMDLINYETTNNKSLTIEHILNTKNIISKILTKIKEMNVSKMLNDYLTDLGEINNYLLSISNQEFFNVVNYCFKCISIDKIENEKSIDLIKLMDLRLKKIIEKENVKTIELNEKYNMIINQLNEYSTELIVLLKNKKKIEKEVINLFKEKNNLNLDNLKIDNMSKKALLILDKLNWVVIDPGINSLLTIMSKDEKTKMNYSKSEYINKIQRKKTQSKIEKIKKEKITKLENSLTKEKTRLRTSNIYKNFNEYFTLKMLIHKSIVKLYQDLKLNKLKWYSFINNRRSETNLVNKIKKIFGNDVVLILGDWSMKKSGIKTISTPNKKTEKLLKNNFLTIEINEFRTSIVENKTKLKCENLIKKMDYKKMSIKEIYNLEKLKEKDVKKYNKKMKDKKIHKILTCKTSVKLVKYINRDLNAVKNMSTIVSSYIKNNVKPITFVTGIKICNNAFSII
jgi:hypothetical protein